VKAPRSRTPTPTVGPTSPASIEQLESIIIKPGVMRGCFGAALTPRQAREVLVREWQACQARPGGVHLTITCAVQGRSVVAGAGYLLDGELRFFVTPELQRHGLGRALVEALRSEAEGQHLPELIAWVFPENVASARLLQACGFMRGASMQVVTFERPVTQYRLALDGAQAHVFGAGQHPDRAVVICHPA
jgi:RimJ/RimL family protein N-acetyltransferase